MLPPFLNPGDKIAITAPSRKISREELAPFLQLVSDQGLEAVYTDRLFGEFNQYSGTDNQRAADLQYWLEQPDVRAVIAARGGYGAARMVDLVDFSPLKAYPKWLIGFSDFTVLHSHVQNEVGIPTMHASMPVFLKTDSNEDVKNSMAEIFGLLKGNLPEYDLPEHPLSQKGNCSGKLVGGNLSVIYSTMGSLSEQKTDGCILFLEDLDEYLYHVDRMMVCLKRAGKLKGLSGILIGHLSDMHDNKIPFGKTAEEIISEHTRDLGIPVYFGFDAGHMERNHPLILGVRAMISDNKLTFENQIVG